MSYRVIRKDGWTVVYARHVDGSWQRWYHYNLKVEPFRSGELEQLLGA